MVMESARHITLLIWKNWLLKRRHPIGLLMEVLLPVAFVILFGVLKNQTTNVRVSSGWGSSDTATTDDVYGANYSLFDSTFAPMTNVTLKNYDFSLFATITPKYYFSVPTMTGIISQLVLSGIPFDNQLATDATEQTNCLPLLLQGQVSPPPATCNIIPWKLAVIGNSDFFAYFNKTVSSWYPRVTLVPGVVTIPSLGELILSFPDGQSFENYISDSSYGTKEKPRVAGAVDFTKTPSPLGSNGQWAYSLRFNGSAFGKGGSASMSSYFGNVPTFQTTAVSPVQKKIDTGPLSIYAYGGLMSLQTLVDRFIICNPVPNTVSDSGVTPRCGNPKAELTDTSSATEEKLINYIANDIYVQYHALLMTRLAAAISGGGGAGGSGGSTGGGAFSGGMPSTSTFTSILAPLLMATPSKEKLLRPLRLAPHPSPDGAHMVLPIASYINAPFYGLVSSVFPLAFILAYLYSVSRVLVAFVMDKELKFRELTKIMGVRDSVIILSWYATYGIIIFLSSILMAGIGTINLFANAKFIGLFGLFFLFGLNVISFCFFLSTLFARAKTAAIVGVVLFFISFMVYYGETSDTTIRKKQLDALLPTVALAQGISLLSAFETNGVTLDPQKVVDNNSFQLVLGMLALDFVLYSLAGGYFDQVKTKKRSYACLLASPCRHCSLTHLVNRHCQKNGEFAKAGFSSSLLDTGVLWSQIRSRRTLSLRKRLRTPTQSNTEPVPSELQLQEKDGRALQILGLSKTFDTPSGPKVALKHLHLNLYEGQITCLLGHNGAGKTTTISMLSGLLEPSEGDAHFRGLSLTDDLKQLRKSMGVCPQHDVLYNDLTVKDHLHLFGGIKGLSGKTLASEAMNKIQEVGLTEKANVPAGQLSGGMKRKLSLAIALIGDSKLVFLDEPTSGMDPYSRRSTWDIIKNNRDGRVIILTTHFMDEADLLGDRIAIMAEGELRCCGSSLFLKQKYGVGYTLTFVRENEAGVEAIQETVGRYIPANKLLSSVGMELAYQIPLEANSSFPKLFKELDEKSKELGVTTYGVSVTTLEEVFIKVAEAKEDHNMQGAAEANALSPTNQGEKAFRLDPNSLNPSRARQFRALFMKRLRYTRRDKRSMCCSTCMPLVMVLFGFAILKTSQFARPVPPQILTEELLKQSQTPIPFACAPVDSSSSSTDSLKACTDIGGNLNGTEVYMSGFTPFTQTTGVISVFEKSYDLSSLPPSQALSLSFAQSCFSLSRSPTYSGNAYGSLLIHSDVSKNIYGYNVGVNTSASVSAPFFSNLANSALYKYLSGNGDASITVTLQQLPLTKQTSAIFSTALGFTAVFFMLMAMSFIPANIVTFIVKEKENSHNSKHLQMVSGASLTGYWLANYCFDIAVYAVTLIMTMILIKAFDITAFTGSICEGQCVSDSFVGTFVLFALFGLSITPFTYLVSFLFKEHTAAQYLVLFLAFITGLVGIIATSVMDSIDSTKEVSKVLKWILRFTPTYSLADALLSIVVQNLRGTFVTITGKKVEPINVFDTKIAGYDVAYMAATFIPYLILTIFVDYAMCLDWSASRFSIFRDPVVQDTPFEEDEDVAREQARVMEGKGQNDLLRLQNLRKVYRSGKVAVKGLSFGLPAGECFGFLGINGAGKTTTMKMLTGDEIPSAGSAYISGKSVITEQLAVRRLIGYCPQFDALLELLSVREHLELFAAIKGVPSEHVKPVITGIMKNMRLTEFADRLAGTLSGGNKRKLSVGIAMIGSPPVLFLDEPSTGMDPVARRFMWTVIARASTISKESTVILTTHSMEECEALCSRVGIMVGGRLRCFGSIQHLKDRFGNGLMLEIRLDDASQEVLMGLTNKIGKESLTQGEIADACTTLGNSSRAQLIHPEADDGWVVQSALNRDGRVSATLFASWWVAQDYYEKLAQRTREMFPNIQLLERHENKSRWKLERGNLRLSSVFEQIENEKKTLSIQEYSVSQVSLEQVFNQFAAQQDEEKGHIRGMNSQQVQEADGSAFTSLSTPNHHTSKN